MRKTNLCFAIVCLLLYATACKTTEELVIKTIEPAPIDLANSIKSIGIANNVEFMDVAGFKDQVTLAVSEEDKRLKEQGIDAALNGLFEELANDTRFDTILLLKSTPIVINGVDGLPTEDSWKSIREICSTNGLDAIFSLAFYDTDTQVSLKKTKMEQRNLLRLKEEVKAHEITLETLIENGWRIYDPFGKEVLDEFVFKDQVVARAKGLSPIRALYAAGDRKDTLLLRSKNSGHAYGSRLQPYQDVVYRDYYISGTEGLTLAREKVSQEDWEGAKTLWENDLSHDKNKIRAMVSHNLAVLNEFKGNLNTALEWAEKSYAFHKSKNTLEYIELLKIRISRQKVLEEQLAYSGISK